LKHLKGEKSTHKIQKIHPLVKSNAIYFYMGHMETVLDKLTSISEVKILTFASLAKTILNSSKITVKKDEENAMLHISVHSGFLNLPRT